MPGFGFGGEVRVVGDGVFGVSHGALQCGLVTGDAGEEIVADFVVEMAGG